MTAKNVFNNIVLILVLVSAYFLCCYGIANTVISLVALKFVWQKQSLADVLQNECS